MLRRMCVRVVLFDEVHNLLAGSQREQRRALNVLNTLANVLQAVIIAAGTRDALLAIQTDAQVARRFEPLELPRWTEDASFWAFVASLLKVLPLRNASAITDRDCIQLLLRRSDGVTAQVCAIIAQSAELAIHNCSETIDLALLDHVARRQHLEPHWTQSTLPSSSGDPSRRYGRCRSVRGRFPEKRRARGSFVWRASTDARPQGSWTPSLSG
jgi:Bacterial TniB protein